MQRNSLIALLTLAAGLAAQTQTTLDIELPTVNPVPRVNDIPFGQPKIRYQQWFQAAQFKTKIKQPVRFVGLEFLGAVPTGVVFDVEIAVANAGPTLQGTFANNFSSNMVVVLPRTKINTVGAATKLPFSKDWIYDGKSNVVVDIRIWGNGINRKFTYTGKSTITTLSNTRRQYFVGNANATVANSSGATGHHGLHCKFLYQMGGSYPYGTGCSGGRFITPVHTSSAVPLPDDKTWTQIVTKAGSGYPAALLLGISRTQGPGSIPLPFNLKFLGASNCNAEASWEFVLFTKTVGGGPGSGVGRMPTPIPAARNLTGVKIYSQWLVFDQAAPNGALSATNSLMHVIGG